jgi:hypothetical protein
MSIFILHETYSQGPVGRLSSLQHGRSISPVAAGATPVPSATQQQQDDYDNEDHFHGKPLSGDE